MGHWEIFVAILYLSWLFLVSYLKFAHAKMCFVFKWIQDGIVTFRGDGNQSEDRGNAANPRQGSIC